MTEGGKELAKKLVESGPFEVVNSEIVMPVFAFSITGDEPFTEFDLSDRLRSKE